MFESANLGNAVETQECFGAAPILGAGCCYGRGSAKGLL